MSVDVRSQGASHEHQTTARRASASEVIGSGAAAGLSTLYYPARERSLTNTGKQWGLDVGIDSATFFFKEFWPDINSKLFHQEQ